MSVKSHASNWTLVRRVVSSRLLVIIGVMIMIVIVCGLLFWLFERKVNESILRKPLNQALLRYRASDGWDELTYRYLGE